MRVAERAARANRACDLVMCLEAFGEMPPLATPPSAVDKERLTGIESHVHIIFFFCCCFVNNIF